MTKWIDAPRIQIAAPPPPACGKAFEPRSPLAIPYGMLHPNEWTAAIKSKSPASKPPVSSAGSKEGGGGERASLEVVIGADRGAATPKQNIHATKPDCTPAKAENPRRACVSMFEWRSSAMARFFGSCFRIFGSGLTLRAPRSAECRKKTRQGRAVKFASRCVELGGVRILFYLNTG